MAKLSNCSRDCTDSRAYNIHSLAFHSLLTPSQDSELWDQVGAQTLALLHTKDMSVCMHVCVHSVPQSHPLHVKWAGKYEVFRGVPGTFVASNFGHLFPRRANAPPPPHATRQSPAGEFLSLHCTNSFLSALCSKAKYKSHTWHTGSFTFCNLPLSELQSLSK